MARVVVVVVAMMVVVVVVAISAITIGNRNADTHPHPGPVKPRARFPDDARGAKHIPFRSHPFCLKGAAQLSSS